MTQQLTVSKLATLHFFQKKCEQFRRWEQVEDGREDVKRTSGVVSDQAQGVWTTPAMSWRCDEDLALHTGETLAVRTELDVGGL